jgi:glycosyltransferase involved in cell wall biosynthesis
VLIAMGRLRRAGPAALALRALEGNLCRRAAAVVAVVPFAGEYLGRYGVAERVLWIPHGVDADLMRHGERAGDGGFMLSYLGAHGPYNSLDTLIEAMAIVRGSAAGAGVRCQLLGAGPAKPALQARAAALGLDNVSFRDPVPRDAVSRIAAETDAFVLCTLDLPVLYRYGVSMNKLFDYMAMGRPVILALAARNNPVAEAGAGITVAPARPAELAEAILALARMSRAERAALGERAERHARAHYDYRVLAGRLAGRLDLCLRQG